MLNHLKQELLEMLNEKELYKFIYAYHEAPIIMIYDIEYNNQTIRLPIDGNNHRIIFENDVEETELTHTFKNKGEYKITIYGDNITYINYGILPFWECFYLKEIVSYGTSKLNKISFKRCISLTKVPDDLIETVDDISEMFSETKNFNQDITNWNTKNIINMSGMFEKSIFNQYISNWDIENVKDMSYMFYNANEFTQNISQWIIKTDINTKNMFVGAGISEENKPIIK
jgi:surface protein